MDYHSDKFKRLGLGLFFIAITSSISLGQDTDQKYLIITIDPSKKVQTIDNFGAAGCWYGEGIGKHWPKAKKEKMAQLPFSQQQDSQGNPMGIGLSA